MRLSLLILLILLPLICTSSHPLKNFEKDISLALALHAEGDSVSAFSLLMKLAIQTQTFMTELGVGTMPPPSPEKSCVKLLGESLRMLARPEWVQLLHEALPHLAALQQSCTSSDFEGGQNSLKNACAICTVISRVMENYVTYHRRDVTDFVENEFCTLFDGYLKPTCEATTHYLGPYLIKAILNKENSDKICHGAGFCKDPTCNIFGHSSSLKVESISTAHQKAAPWQWLVDLFTKKFGDRHLPPFDLDNDTFSDISTFRGHHWRGADCNQVEADVYPGRRVGKRGWADHDCNGIFGKDTKGKDLEETLCKDSVRLGVAVIGDSAGAHFSIPEKYFNVTMMGPGNYKDFIQRASDELDVPHESGYTGHFGLSHSVYKYLRNWNLCNNNDYQNIGVNGGASGNTRENIRALKRDPQKDHPMLVFLELIGNDVCAKSFDGMTKPADFKKNILQLLAWLDKTLPKGSHLVILGLAQGDLLYQYLHGATHPLNVSYDAVYDFLNCLNTSPCWGWLNTKEEVRKKTTQKAMQLTKIYQEIISEGYKAQNFDIVYYDFPTQQIIERKAIEGGDPRTMIEPCDGFHPSGEFHGYLADWLWFNLLVDHPEWFGQSNPHNEQIKKLFGLSNDL